MIKLELVPLPNDVGSEIRGLDPDGIGPPEEAWLRDAFLQNSVLVLRGARLTPEAHIAMTRVLGKPEIHPMTRARQQTHPEIIEPRPYGAEETDDPEEIVGQITWHADQSYTQRPSRGALLRSIEIPPEGGQTGFVDTAAVYAALPEDRKSQIEGLELVHRLARGQRLLGLDSEEASEVAERFPDVAHPLVRVDPTSGIRSLDISPMFGDAVVGWPVEESEALLESLRAFATQSHFVYWHDWKPDDLVIWNNYRTLHCAAGHRKKFVRTMNRTTLEGEVDGRRVA
jgi:taurine dioxygenase